MYKEEFVEAISRTKRFDLECPEIQFLDGLKIDNEAVSKLPYVLLDTVGEISLTDLVGQCMSIHSGLVKPISKITGTECYFTIGFVDTGSQKMFYQTEDSLKEMLDKGVNNSAVSLHAWLTLPTMEIMDFTIATSYAMVNGHKEGLGSIIGTHADSLNGDLKYHPMLVGENFLFKAGIVKGFMLN